MAKGKSDVFSRLVPYFLGGLGIALMVIGVLVNYLQIHQKTTERLKKDVASEPTLREINLRRIKVDVSGAVERPGVYEIPDDSRVKDVLITAGGLAAKADRNYISKSVNLAQRVVDGTKFYFPFENEVSQGSFGQTALGSATQTSYQLNINTATSAELDALPGVGPVTAGRIIAARPYQNISELVSRKIVTNSVYQKIKDRVIAQ